MRRFVTGSIAFMSLTSRARRSISSASTVVSDTIRSALTGHPGRNRIPRARLRRHTTSTKSPYPPSVSSSVSRIIGSTHACATNILSNGSL